jgi:hypothetical protein
LGTFVSGSVAKKEHDQFASNIDLIDVLPPGLYEAVMTPKEAGSTTADLVSGDYLVRFEARTLEDIRAFGGNTEEDERRFAAAARVSEINLGLYRTFVQPWVRAWTNEGLADWMRRMHPVRIPFEMFSPKNPFLSSLAPLVEGVRKDRQSVSRDNALWQTQERIGKAIESSLDAYCDMRDRLVEKLFHDVYGSPLLQSLVGLKSSDATPRPRPGVDAVYRAFVAQRIEELTRKIAEGDPREAAVRALLYIRMPEGVADECGFRLLERMREEVGTGLSLAAFKTLVRDQFFTLLLDERRAVEAIPTMLDADPEQASRMASVLRKLVEVVGVESKSGKARLAEIEAIFEARKKVRAPKNGGPREGHPETVRSVRSPASKSGPHSRNLS